MMYINCVYALGIWMCLEYLHLGIKFVKCAFVAIIYRIYLCGCVRVCVLLSKMAAMYFCV